MSPISIPFSVLFFWLTFQPISMSQVELIEKNYKINKIHNSDLEVSPSNAYIYPEPTRGPGSLSEMYKPVSST